MNDIVVGIDLGTTFSAVAWVGEGSEPAIVLNDEQENITPSAVLIEGDRFVVGRAALNQAAARPNDVALWIKRQMGIEGYRFQGRFTPEEISAQILKKLAGDAEKQLGRAVRRVVITVPAYFNGTQREKTKLAGEMAGLTVEELRDEPEAAAIYFGIRNLKEGERVLVCDLGGGTYDATVLVLEQGSLRAEKTRGSWKLGGFDWTQALVELVSERILAATGSDPNDDLHQWQLLYDACERAKKTLSTVPQTAIPWTHDGKSTPVPVSRADFEARCQPLMEQVRTKTAEAVRDAGIAMKDLQHVLLVGGSSRLPSFVATIAELTGITPRKVRNPDEAVALGAAIVAHGYETGNGQVGGGIQLSSGAGSTRVQIAIRSIASHALGTRVVERKANRSEIVSEVMIPESTALPAARDREFAVGPGQVTFQVPVIELDSHGNIQDWHGNYRFFGVPKRTTKSPIRVRFEVDARNKIPEVTAIDVLTGNLLDRQRMPYEEPTIPPDGGGGKVTVVLAVDCSASMMGEKIQQARLAVAEIARKYLQGHEERQVAVVNFGGPVGIYPATILLPPTRSLSEIDAAAVHLIADGGTPMAAGMERIREILEVVPGQRIAIIITDGFPDSAATAEQRAQTLSSQGILIGTVPIGNDVDQNFLRRIGQLESNLQVDSSGKGMTNSVLDILSKIEEDRP